MAEPSERAATVVRVLERVMAVPTSALAVVGAAWIFVLMVLVNLDVFGRTLFLRPVDGVPEIISMSIVGIVFLQLANTLRRHRFIRSDMLIGRLLERRPRAGHAAEAVYHLVGAAVFGLVCWYVLPKFQDALQYGTYVGNLGRFTMPTWPFLLIILVGAGLTGVQYVAHVLHSVLIAVGAVPPPAPPVGENEIGE